MPTCRTAAVLAVLAALAACGTSPAPPADAAAADTPAPDAAPDAADPAPDAPADAPFVPAEHPMFPQVPANLGVVIRSPTLVTVVAQNDTLADHLHGLGDLLRSGAWWRTVTAEYGVGPIARTARITLPPITADVRARDLRDQIATAVAAQGAPAPDGSGVVYLVFLPDGVNEVIDAYNMPNTDCHFHRGGHQPYRFGRLDSLAIVQRCPLEPGETTEDELTEVGSHEVFESVTDPAGDASGWALVSSPTTPWNDDVWGSFVGPGTSELADLCHDTRTREGGYSLQRSWSNAAAALGGDPCVPATSAPYYNASTEQGWYALDAGRATITVTGFASAPRGDWLVRARPIAGGRGFHAELTGDQTRTIGTTRYVVANNGTAATLTVTVDPGAQDNYAVYWILSSVPDPATGEDLYHIWPVGVYAP